MTILVLGGTSEARQLAGLLDSDGIDFVSSLAGRVAKPRLPVGAVRIGGFGGVSGLVNYLAENDITAVVDATHPFAEGMTRNAVAARAECGVPLLRLERPGWSDAPGADAWHWVDGHGAAAQLAGQLGDRPFLTVGRQDLATFTGALARHATLVRVVDLPQIEIPAMWRVVTSRGPYDAPGERSLMAEHSADVLVTKDSGGTFTWPKMQVADELGIPIVVVRRSAAPAGIATVNDADAAVAWVLAQR